MRIVHFGTSDTPVNSVLGGALQRRQLEMARLQAEDGHEVVIVSAGEVDGQIDIDGVRVEFVNLRRDRPLRDWEMLIKAWRRLRTEPRFDVMHAHGAPHAGELARRVARASVHSVDFFTYRGSSHPAGRRLYERQLGRFDITLPVSNYCYEEFRDFYPGVRRVEVLVNGVNIDQFAPSEEAATAARTSLGLPTGPLAVYVGRVCEQKGSDMLIPLAAHLRAHRPDVTVVAAGPGEAFSSTGTTPLMEELSSAGVVVTGAVPETRLPGLMALATVGLLPTRRLEMFGMAALEALACGTPVVASNQGGIPEAVGQSGVIFPVGDDCAFGSAVLHLLDDEPRRTALGATGREHAESYRWRVVVDRAQELYAEARRVARG